MSVFVIAEIGVNHNGSEALAIEMIDAAAACGADAVKFQSFNADKLVVRGAEKADYQKRETGDGDQHSMLRQLEMSGPMHVRLAEHSRQTGIEFMSTPFDEDAARFLVSLGMARVKVSSAEITNHPFLQYLAGFDVPLILSTGMASMCEVEAAVDVIRTTRLAQGRRTDLARVLTLLHCTSNYPARLQDVNLKAMQTMHDRTGLPVGYSDHTEGILVSAAAVGMGASVLEKHFTLDRMLDGPDHKASLEPDQFAAMVRQIRDLECALGSAEKVPAPSELPVRDLVRRSIVVDKTLARGSRLSREDLVFLRPGTGISPSELDRVTGMKLARSVQAGEMLHWEDLEQDRDA